MSGLIKHNRGLVMSEDQETLLKSVLEVPEDDAARLIYADYLELDLGDESSVCHAHLIRHQIAKHQSGKSCKSLDRKERKWLWKIQVPELRYFRTHLSLGDWNCDWKWERGFISEIKCAYGYFTEKNSQWSWTPPVLKFGYSIPVLRLDELLFGRYPITKLSFYDAHEMITPRRRLSAVFDTYHIDTSRVGIDLMKSIYEMQLHTHSEFIINNDFYQVENPNRLKALVYASVKNCLSAIQLGSINYARDRHGLTALELVNYPQLLSI
jgi:uncharacterized protein (TIGR02996 family)